jgi:hypothetical protein
MLIKCHHARLLSVISYLDSLNLNICRGEGEDFSGYTGIFQFSKDCSNPCTSWEGNPLSTIF